MKEHSTSSLYDLWAKVYDSTFGRLVVKRQLRAVDELHLLPGQRVLDLGIGTGMTLGYYPDNVQVVGIDLSRGMLNKAAEKIEQNNLKQVTLIQGDAMLPPFAEGSFDCILVTHVISVVSDPHNLLDWARRLLKPGGRMVLLNHFQSSHGVIRFFEKLLNPLFVKIGWRSDLDLSELMEDSPLGMQYQFKLGLFDLWQIVVLTDATKLSCGMSRFHTTTNTTDPSMNPALSSS